MQFSINGKELFNAIQLAAKIIGIELNQISLVLDQSKQNLAVIAKSMHRTFQQLLNVSALDKSGSFAIDSKRLALICKNRQMLQFSVEKTLAFREVTGSYKGKDINITETTLTPIYNTIAAPILPTTIQEKLLVALSFCQIKSVFNTEQLGCNIFTENNVFYVAVADRFHAVITNFRIDKSDRKTLENFKPITVPLEYIILLKNFATAGLRLLNNGKQIQLQNNELLITLPAIQTNQHYDIKQLLTTHTHNITLEKADRLGKVLDNLTAVAKGRKPIVLHAAADQLHIGYNSTEGRLSEKLPLLACDKTFKIKVEPHNGYDILSRLKGNVNLMPTKSSLNITHFDQAREINVFYITALLQT